MHWEHIQEALELLAIHFAPVEAFLKSRVISQMNCCNEWLLACGTWAGENAITRAVGTCAMGGYAESQPSGKLQDVKRG
jgi:hypothetical protein